MEAPKVESVLIDQKNQIKYVVMAYRKLSKEELILYVRTARSKMKKSKLPRKGTTLTLVTTIGADD